jgi:hypothetical protein
MYRLMDFISNTNNPILSKYNYDKFDNIPMDQLNNYIKNFENQISRSLPPSITDSDYSPNTYQLPPINTKLSNISTIKHTNHENENNRLTENG